MSMPLRWTSREVPEPYDYTHDQSDGSLVVRDGEDTEEDEDGVDE